MRRILEFSSPTELVRAAPGTQPPSSPVHAWRVRNGAPDATSSPCPSAPASAGTAPRPPVAPADTGFGGLAPPSGSVPWLGPWTSTPPIACSASASAIRPWRLSMRLAPMAATQGSGASPAPAGAGTMRRRSGTVASRSSFSTAPRRWKTRLERSKARAISSSPYRRRTKAMWCFAITSAASPPSLRRNRRFAGSAISRPRRSMAIAAAAGSMKLPRFRPAARGDASAWTPRPVGSISGGAMKCRCTSSASPAFTDPAAAPSIRR